MSSQTAMSLMSLIEFGLWVALALIFWGKNLDRRFPAMGAYLALRVVSTPVLLVLFGGQAQHWFNNYAYMCYFFGYWAVYVASAVILFFVCQEIFRFALSAFSGLQRLGTVAFRWVALVSAFISLSTLSIQHASILIIPAIAYKLMRSVSILELCLLAFVCLSMNALRLSVRNVAFGMALGFGAMASSDFIAASFGSRMTTMTDPLQFVSESVTLVALLAWIVYAILPEPAHKPITMPVNSVVLRWNEIACALGHTGTQVAVQQPVSGFFLSDVEKVVEDVLTRNLKSRESET